MQKLIFKRFPFHFALPGFVWITAKIGGFHSITTKNSIILESGALEWEKNKCSVELLSYV